MEDDKIEDRVYQGFKYSFEPTYGMVKVNGLPGLFTGVHAAKVYIDQIMSSKASTTTSEKTKTISKAK